MTEPVELTQRKSKRPIEGFVSNGLLFAVSYGLYDLAFFDCYVD